MAITIHKSGGISIVGPESVNLYRLKTMVVGLQLEIKTSGKMRLTRGPSCHTLAKREFGLKGNREKVLEQLLLIVAEAQKEHGPPIKEE